MKKPDFKDPATEILSGIFDDCRNSLRNDVDDIVCSRNWREFICQALEEAYEAGRVAGIDEAAKVADQGEGLGKRTGYIGDNIRALKSKQDSNLKGEGK